MLWVTYRQHRSLLFGTVAALVLLGSTSLVRDFVWVPDRMEYLFFGAIVAVFWGAPLLSREYEERTHLLAWSQDVTPVRWLLGKVAVLGAFASVIAVVLGVLGSLFSMGFRTDNPWLRFELAVLPQLGYVWFGLALGIALSAVTRRTVLAMGLAAVSFAIVRTVLARWGREHYLPVIHTWRPDPEPGTDYVRQLPDDALWVASGYADKDGNPMPVPPGCNGDDECLKAAGQIGHYVDYQPVERVFTFQLIEFGIFTVLAAVLLWVAFTTLRRAVRPTRTATAAP